MAAAADEGDEIAVEDAAGGVDTAEHGAHGRGATRFAERGSGAYVMAIRTRDGLPVTAISANAGEDEVIIPPGAALRCDALRCTWSPKAWSPKPSQRSVQKRERRPDLR
ncbi:hypothetical protein [Mycolicibacterium helvum]|uniref:hypothetical protein n=1 Tax=Mycolicibacterium helvum TaxID=1534349 RepID=UPI001C656A21|nr:hypothetical protein [Mycolicibacterium helvum]